MINIVIDPPSDFASNDVWVAFLAEMRKAHRSVRDIDTAMEIDRNIKMAQDVLRKRGVT